VGSGRLSSPFVATGKRDVTLSKEKAEKRFCQEDRKQHMGLVLVENWILADSTSRKRPRLFLRREMTKAVLAKVLI
jgi:hypothetical protein